MVRAFKKREGEFLSTGSGFDNYTFSPERKISFLALCRKFWPDISRCCRTIGISNVTFYTHLKKDEKFFAAVEEIKLAKIDAIEATGMRQAAKPKSFLDRAMMLRAHRPELYDRAKVVRLEGGAVPWQEASQGAKLAEAAVDAEIVGNYRRRKTKVLGAGDGAGGDKRGAGQ